METHTHGSVEPLPDPNAEKPHWMVEITRHGVPDGVGADVCQIEAGGVLTFYNYYEGKKCLSLAYAPGSWLTVTEE